LSGRTNDKNFFFSHKKNKGARYKNQKTKAVVQTVTVSWHLASSALNSIFAPCKIF